MVEPFRVRPGSDGEMWEPSEQLDPFLELREEARPWELRAAQWRAWALAVEAFGQGSRVLLGGNKSLAGFLGHLMVEVPFTDMSEHRRREALFLAWIRRDPVFLRVPLVFVFRPLPAPPGESPEPGRKVRRGRRESASP